MSTRTSDGVMTSLPASELAGLIAKRNPDSSRVAVEAAGKIFAVLGIAVLGLPIDRQVVLASKVGGARLAAAVLDALKQLAAEAEDLSAYEQGDGLKPPLSAKDGAARLEAYAKPQPIEAWAGPVAGSTELQRDYRISRSTLHEWQKSNAVIGLLSGVRKHVFPLAQFVDGRPVQGLGHVAAAAGSPRTAWLWLVEPHPSLGRHAPLERLKTGHMREVHALADSDFGPS